ncbi:MAG: hypothetical protein ACRDUY_16985 [Nitriliruptorales bacterium]
MSAGRLLVAAAACVVLAAACDGGTPESVNAPGSAPEPSPTETTPGPGITGPLAFGQSDECVGPTWSVELPADWHTNEGQVLPPCSIFHPEQFELEEATQIPFDLAVTVREDQVDFETASGEDTRGVDVTSRSEATVDGRTAVVIDGVGTGETLIPEGLEFREYVVDLDGAVLIASTYAEGELDFEEKTAILDQMMQTLEIRFDEN